MVCLSGQLIDHEGSGCVVWCRVVWCGVGFLHINRVDHRLW